MINKNKGFTQHYLRYLCKRINLRRPTNSAGLSSVKNSPGLSTVNNSAGLPSTINSAGFTLIELLVVIGIISVLSAVAVPNFMGARERARDTQRKSDVRQIQKALELYKDDQSPVITYPAALPGCGAAWIVSSTTYMNKLPCDPAGTDYSYTRDAGDSLEYDLFACLENKSDPDGEASDECPSLIKYQITEP